MLRLGRSSGGGASHALRSAVARAAPRVPRRHRSAGLVGLPNVGKSTLMNALTGKQMAAAENYPFTTIEPNHASVTVPDPLLQRLGAAAGARRTVLSTVEFTDVAGLVRGASSGEGLGNKFLGNVRACAVILHVIRCYEDEDVLHVSSRVDPTDDMDAIETELVLADLQTVERRLAAAAKKRADRPELVRVLERCFEVLNDGRPLREAGIVDVDGGAAGHAELSAREADELRTLQLLTAKPVVYVCNVGEEDAATGNELSREVERVAAEQRGGQRCVTISAALEEDATREAEALDGGALEYLELVAGLERTGLDRVIAETAEVLGVHPFYTVGEQEARSWMVRRGTTAVDAAAKIHSDIARAFIRAEVVRPDDLLELGTMEACRKAGRASLEGKDYVVQQADCIEFRHNG